jgi:sulfonate transport system substrate-binding protein
VKIAFLGPMDAKPALVSGAIDAWAIWEPYVSIALLNDGALVLLDGRGLTPTITFVVANETAIKTKRAALVDLLLRLRNGWLWARDNIPAYAAYNSRLTGVPVAIMHHAYESQKTAPIVIDDAIIKEVQQAADLAHRFGILSKRLNVSSTVDRSFSDAVQANQ